MNASIEQPLPSERTADPGLFQDSTLREKILEHVLIVDLLRMLWRTGRRDIEVLRAEVDRGGYDLVLESNGILRHIQLKSSYRGARTTEVAIQVNLARKPGGCVLWMQFDPATLELGPFYWFGGAPGEKLPDLGSKIARHTKADSQGLKAERPMHRSLRKGSFTQLDTIEEVVTALFGAPQPLSRSYCDVSVRATQPPRSQETP